MSTVSTGEQQAVRPLYGRPTRGADGLASAPLRQAAVWSDDDTLTGADWRIGADEDAPRPRWALLHRLTRGR